MPHRAYKFQDIPIGGLHLEGSPEKFVGVNNPPMGGVDNSLLVASGAAGCNYQTLGGV